MVGEGGQMVDIMEVDAAQMMKNKLFTTVTTFGKQSSFDEVTLSSLTPKEGECKGKCWVVLQKPLFRME